MPEHEFLFATLPGSFVSIESSTGRWRLTLRIPKRAICSGSSLRERNWTGSSQLAWPLLHILDGQMLDWQCLVACMHAKKNSADHAESGVRKSIQRRQLRSACSEGASPRTLVQVENGTHSTASRPCHQEPRPAGYLLACSCQCYAAITLADAGFHGVTCRNVGYGL